MDFSWSTLIIVILVILIIYFIWSIMASSSSSTVISGEQDASAQTTISISDKTYSFALSAWIYVSDWSSTTKDKSIIRYLAGGSIFGLGWALSGACPGPMVVNIGYGFLSMTVVLFFAIVGTYLYGVFMKKLPH